MKSVVVRPKNNFSYYICRMPIITLTSDFGIQSHALASVKGKILCQLSDAQIIDISHTQEGFNLQQTAYHFKQAFIHFPEGSFHFVFNDLYADKNHKLLYAYENKQHIFCADNGFLTMLFDDKPMQMYCLQDKIQPYTFLTVADHFIASVRSILLYNEFPIVSIDVSKIIIRHPSKPFYTNDMLEAQVLYIDPYGNVILNVQRKQLEEIAAGRNLRFCLCVMKK
jgi:S-adenosylmethionine hydrolase